MKRRAIVAANWKMNGGLELVKTMTTGLNNLDLAENVDVIICPSSLYLSAFEHDKLGKSIHLGAQNVSEHQKGAFTGEISTTMLQELSVEFVIIGHSERRSILLNLANKLLLKLKQL